MDILKKRSPRLIFLVLGLVILIEVVFVANAISQNPPPPKKSTSKSISDAQIALVSDQKNLKLGENLQAQIKLTTGGHPTSGTDVVLKYDPAFFNVLPSSVKAGKIYPDYPIADIDTESGTIRVSGIAGITTKGFNGVGILATVNLTTKKTGNTKISFEYKKGSTADSNVIGVADSTDLLGKVTDLEVNIR